MKKSKRTKKISKKHRKKGSRLLDFFVLVFFFFLSAGASYYYFKGMFAFESAFIADIEARKALLTKHQNQPGDNRLYGSDKGGQTEEAERVFRKDNMLIVAEDIIRKNLKPYKVRLLDLYFDKEGMIYMDVGSEIVKNFKGDALEEMNLIGGLYKGIKAAVPGFKALKILIQGKEAESIGGHIDISRPIGGEIARNI